MIDHTHEREARSWVSSANGHREFPLQNLPFGVFSPRNESPRCGVAIGDEVLDLRAAGHLLPETIGTTLAGESLAPFLALGAEARRSLRHALFALLHEGSEARSALEPLLFSAADIRMGLPARPGGFTDFYAGIVHASNVGALLRPDNPLMPNYKFVPIGYHGRTSSIRPSGAPVRRPRGQLKDAAAAAPVVGEAQRLDFEVELGLWIGPGNKMGEPINIADAGAQLAGVTLLNDWSARDIQAWEYQPLGPFLAKNFATTVSPWLVTAEALAPFRTAQKARPETDPAPLAYLFDRDDQAHGAFDIAIEVAVRTAQMRERQEPPTIIGRTNATHLYWTPAQLITHHASNGCPLESGDLLGTGTISAPRRDGLGSLMEMTMGGKEPIVVGGEERRFLEDGDEVFLTGRCEREGFARIGFGACEGLISPANK